MYGARGANGVIMVTTKKAKSGDAVVTIDAKWGVNSKALEEYDVITSPAQYYETHFKALYGYYAQTNPAAKAYALASSGLTSNGTGGLGYNVYTVPEGQALIGTNGKLNPNATLGRKIIYNGQGLLADARRLDRRGLPVGVPSGIQREHLRCDGAQLVLRFARLSGQYGYYQKARRWSATPRV